MKFWGKIRGTEYDYFIVEGKIGLEDGVETPEGCEPRGDPGAVGFGTNEFVYWASNSPLEDWT